MTFHPDKVINALRNAGWTTVSGRKGSYVRMGIPSRRGTRHHVLVPTDHTAPEFEEMATAVLAVLDTIVADGQMAGQALKQIRADLQ